jgi:hypothetical protein
MSMRYGAPCRVPVSVDSFVTAAAVGDASAALAGAWRMVVAQAASNTADNSKGSRRWLALHAKTTLPVGTRFDDACPQPTHFDACA